MRQSKGLGSFPKGSKQDLESSKPSLTENPSLVWGASGLLYGTPSQPPWALQGSGDQAAEHPRRPKGWLLAQMSDTYAEALPREVI